MHLALLVIIYLAFISLGLPDGVLGVAWTAIRLDLDQPLAAVGLLTILLTVSSGTCTLFSGVLIRRLGTGPIVMFSGLLTGLALLGFRWCHRSAGCWPWVYRWVWVRVRLTPA